MSSAQAAPDYLAALLTLSSNTPQNMFIALRYLSIACLLFFMSACSSLPEKEKEKLSKQDRFDLAMQQEFEMTRDPALGYIPKERLVQGQEIMEGMQARTLRTAALTWAERGPNNVAGRIRALIIDSRDATGNTVFASSVSGGIWKATGFKNAPLWTPVAENMGSLAVSALAQDPSNAQVMYAGTGEGWGNADAVRGNGIWKSIDGGTTWNQLASTDSSANNRSHNYDYIQDVIVTAGGVVFASARPSVFCNTGGVFRSADGGTSWQRVIGTFPNMGTCPQAEDFYAADLEIAGNGDLYATAGFSGTRANNPGRIFRSAAAANGANVGAPGTWTNITPTGTWERIELSASASTPGTVYALFEVSNRIGSIQRTVDFGASWQTLTIPTWCNQGSSSTDFTNGQAWYDLIVSVDPNNSNTVMIGGIDLFRSINGGTSWTQVSQWAANCGGLPNVHADQHNIVYYPGSSSEIIATNDGGIYYSGDGGVNWLARNSGLNITQFYACDYHPTATDYFLAGAQDNGTQRFTTAGINATSRVTGGDGGFPHIDQTDGQIQVTAFVYNNYFWSRNGGTSFSTVPGANDRGQFINPTDYSDAANVLYAGDDAGNYFYVSNFETTPTTGTNALLAMGNREITAVKVDPFADNTVWFGASFGTGLPMILKVTNANTAAPTVALSTTIPVVANAYFSSIDVDPANANHLLATFSNYGVNSIWESTNSGTSWTSIEGNFPDVPVRWGIFAGPNTQLNGTTGGNGGILIGTELGVWTTSAISGSGTTWIPNRNGLPNVRVDQLKYRNDGLIAAATHGRGLYTTILTNGGITTGVPSVPNSTGFIRYVSGTNNLLIVTGNLTTTRKMDIQIFNMNGQLVHRSSQSYQTTSVPLNNLSSGSYIVRITGDKKELFTAQFIH